MSADNGIYILKTPKYGESSFEYRTAYHQAIDNINYNEPSPGHGNALAVLRYFGDCKVHTDEDAAWLVAYDMEKDCDYLEYGVSMVELPHSMRCYGILAINKAWTNLEAAHKLWEESEYPADNKMMCALEEAVSDMIMLRKLKLL